MCKGKSNSSNSTKKLNC
uniref:Uncharacterized protein n=1 Tax=Arundo donax TaxID=35708 RepID=A0A0A9F4A2_ARUDO